VCAGLGAAASARGGRGSVGGGAGGDAKLDADHIDVYKGAHAVVVLFDITRRDSWTYVVDTVARIPAKLPILLLANFRDRGDARAVPEREVAEFAESACRERGGKHADDREKRVQTAECSLADCFGLKTLYNYFNVPFLELKISTLKEQVKATQAELVTVSGEVGLGS